MIQFCIMSGHEAKIRPEPKIYVTLMGGCDLKRETVARRILTQRQRQREGKDTPPKQFFLTLMGGTAITCPTLAEEFLDLQQLIRAGELSLADWDRALADLGRLDVSIASFTLMGAFSECELPSETEEIDSLALQRHLGNISADAGEVLQHGIGQRDAERHSVVRRALQTAM
ncbi:MAG: hypothetical protein Q7R41_15375 [Phycisphaerales bacterium]|nr:hypothetical protein [Phycisphaerales bacterium]